MISVGLVMRHLQMPKGGQVDHTVDENNRILFIRWGKGRININGKDFSVEKESYLYLEKGLSYSIQSSEEKGLDILIFE